MRRLRDPSPHMLGELVGAWKDVDVAEPPTAVRIFISYRRGDARATAGRIFDRLTAHFGDGTVFMDVDSISPGHSFTDTIDDAVTSCRVMLAVIAADG